MRELGRRIKARRGKLGLSQTELGRRVARSHGQIHNLEYGRTANPPAELLTALAVELGEDPSDYLRMAGRVALTAESVIPATPAALPVGLLDAIEERVRLAIREELHATQQRVAIPPVETAEPAPRPAVGPALWIRLARVARGMTPGQVAVRLGVNARTVELWEAGTTQPSLRQVQRLAELYAGTGAEISRGRRKATG